MNEVLARNRLLHFASLLCSLILLLGRWSPARFLGYGVFPPLYLDLRVYLTVLCVAALFATMGKAALTKDGLAVLCILFGLGLYHSPSSRWTRSIGLNLKPYDYVEIKLVDVLILTCLVWVFYLFAQQPTFEERLWTWVLRIGLVLTLMGGVSALTSTITYDERLTVLGAEGGNFFSRIVGMAAVIFAVHIGRGDRPAWLFAAGLGIAAMVIILSGSRGATIATAISVGLVLLLSPRRMFMLILLAALGAVGIMLVFSLPPEIDGVPAHPLRRPAGHDRLLGAARHPVRSGGRVLAREPRVRARPRVVQPDLQLGLSAQPAHGSPVGVRHRRRGAAVHAAALPARRERYALALRRPPHAWRLRSLLHRGAGQRRPLRFPHGLPAADPDGDRRTRPVRGGRDRRSDRRGTVALDRRPGVLRRTQLILRRVEVFYSASRRNHLQS